MQSTEYGVAVWNESMGMYGGDYLLSDDGQAFMTGRPIIVYEQIFDENGEWIGEKEVQVGVTRLIILSGPYDSYADAAVWYDEHLHDYGF